jgi:hypothetical protein
MMPLTRKEHRERNARIWAPIIAAARERLAAKRPSAAKRQGTRVWIGICGADPAQVNALTALLYGDCQVCGRAIDLGDDVYVRPCLRRTALFDFTVAHPKCAVVA